MKFSLIASVAVSALVLTACGSDKKGGSATSVDKQDKAIGFEQNLQDGSWMSKCVDGKKWELDFMKADKLVAVYQHTYQEPDCRGAQGERSLDKMMVYEVSQVNGNSAQLQTFESDKEQYGANDFVNVKGQAVQAVTASIDENMMHFVGLFKEDQPLVDWVRVK